ncbi:glycosyltransferase-related [Schistosoma mansoni]|uniref:glycosyltransferase-related n=1 Tax=Schistosoma mansoni TaxID=6183 RepID=UPI00022C8325|nr:glycosyltransferase-related [Schistosoma mansoni]|eukprot:XP_018646039.1 glycosyltransferase-related [Schistosoma mansoni]
MASSTTCNHYCTCVILSTKLSNSVKVLYRLQASTNCLTELPRNKLNQIETVKLQKISKKEKINIMYIKWSIKRKPISMTKNQSILQNIHSHIYIIIRRLHMQTCYILLICCCCCTLLLIYEKQLFLSYTCQINFFQLSSLCSMINNNEQKLEDSIDVEHLQGTQFQISKKWFKKKIITIDISLVIGGAQAARGLVTLIKSILLQRKWERSVEFSKFPRPATLKSTVTFNGKETIMDNVNKHNECYIRHINLHLISDYHAFKSLSTLFDTWNIPNFNVYFYQLELYLHKVSWIPSTHYSGLFGLSKLLIPEILPESVEKVINLDVDLLVNSDLLELWAHFQKFNTSQMIGLVANQSPWYLRKTNRIVWPAWGPGFNTGVMLLDLVRLRESHWSEHWYKTTKSALQHIPYSMLADQDIINAALVEIPSIIYQLPCEWNVQLTSNMNIKLCAIIWSNDYSIHNVQSFHSNPFESFNYHLKIAHFNHPIKADMITLNEIIDDDQLRLRLKRQFMRMYRYYQNFDGTIVQSPGKLSSCSEYYNPSTFNRKINQTSSKNTITIDGCEEFSEDLLKTHRIHPYYYKYNFSTFTMKDKENVINMKNHVSLVSQLTFDRLHRLEELAIRWLGPMSLALYLTDREATLLIEYITNSRILQNRTNIGYHIVYVDGVQWSADYEPYVIVSRHTTMFDEIFIGFGWNKASYIMALDALGYKFIVLTNVFLIHLPHPPSFEVFRYRMNSVYRYANVIVVKFEGNVVGPLCE